jgi:hypothetical protein
MDKLLPDTSVGIVRLHSITGSPSVRLRGERLASIRDAVYARIHEVYNICRCSHVNAVVLLENHELEVCWWRSDSAPNISLRMIVMSKIVFLFHRIFEQCVVQFQSRGHPTLLLKPECKNMIEAYISDIGGEAEVRLDGYLQCSWCKSPNRTTTTAVSEFSCQVT